MTRLGGDLACLSAETGNQWRNLEIAWGTTATRRATLRDLIVDLRLAPEDTAFVVFGSLARGEATEDSDLDWTLLLDGPADQSHWDHINSVKSVLQDKKFLPPGRGGLFGGLAISHELVHRIGGESDSNANITQRVLLLLESYCPAASEVRTRVINVLLKRYLVDDFGYPQPPAHAARVPRFLLNDVVRYWRTIAVDFAAKRRERDGEGWGLRNFKLRMSRKLIFAAGLIACLACKLRPPKALSNPEAKSEDDYSTLMAAHLSGFVDRTPLETLAWAAREFGATEDTVSKLFGSYDSFLGILADPDRRAHLKRLTPTDVSADTLFGECRKIGDSFQEGLTSLFVETDNDLRDATLRYGVF